MPKVNFHIKRRRYTMAKIKKPLFPELPEEPEVPEVPEEEGAMMKHAAYIPIAKMGRFAGIAIGTTVTVYTDNKYYPYLYGYFQGLVKDHKDVIALILSNGVLFRIPVKEAKFVAPGASYPGA